MTESAWIFLGLAIFNGINGIFWFYKAMDWMTKYHDLKIAHTINPPRQIDDEFPGVIDER